MGTPRLIERHSTRWSVYAVAFSPDGNQLAYGDGSFYGDGDIGCIAPGRGVVASVRLRDVLDQAIHGSDGRFVTVSGLSFDGSGRFLAASAWMRYGPRPPMVFRIEEPRLVLVHDCGPAEMPPPGNSWRETGLCLHRGRAVEYHFGTSPEWTFAARDVPEELVTDGLADHLRNCRMARIGDVFVGHFNVDRGDYKVRHGRHLLLATSAAEGFARRRLVDALHPITAITASPGGLLITGGLDGTICFWRPGDPESDGLPALTLERQTAPPAEPRAASAPSLPDHHDFRPGSQITAMCMLHDGDGLLVAHKDGRMRLWRDGRVDLEWFLPSTTPRSLCAHPAARRLAIGCRRGAGAGDPGSVLLYDID